MPRHVRSRRLTSMLVAAGLVVASCSGSDGAAPTDSVGAPTDATEDSSPPATDEVAPDTSVTPEERAPDTADVEPDESSPRAEFAIEPESVDGLVDTEGQPIEVPPYAASTDALDAGIEQGSWTEIEGVRALLQWYGGAADRPDIVGLDVESESLSSLIRRARAVTETATPDEAAEIEELIDALFIDTEAFAGATTTTDVDTTPAPVPDPVPAETEAFVGGGNAAASQATPAVTQGVGGCALEGESGFDDITTSTACYRKVGVEIGDAEIAVFYPTSEGPGAFDVSEADATETLQTLVTTVSTLADFAATPNIHLAFSVGPASDDSDDGGNTLAAADNPSPTRSSSICRITVFVTARPDVEDLSALVGNFAQAETQRTIAHEAVHCVQFADLGTNDGPLFAWEGPPEVVAHLLFPQLPPEHQQTFDQSSMRRNLTEMTHAGWYWWLYLMTGAGFSLERVWELHAEYIETPNIQNVPDVEGIFHRMFVDFAGPGIPLFSGERFSTNVWDRTNATVGVDQTLNLSASQLAGFRTLVEFPQQHAFDISDDANRDLLAGRDSWVQLDQRSNRSAWGSVPATVRSSCRNPGRWLVVSTGTTGDHNPDIRTTSQEAPCDPCWIGTWSVDNDSFRSVVLGAVESSGEVPAGIEVDFLLDGDYFVQVGDDSGWTAWRRDYSITVGTPAGNIVSTISSLESGTWTATASSEDGGRSEGSFGIPTSQTIDVRSSTQIDGLGTATVTPGGATATVFGQTGSVATPDLGESTSSAGRYSCDDDGDLEIFIDGFDSQIVLQRVAEPPAPPSSLEPADS